MKIFGREVSIIDEKFKQNKMHYFLQCAMATFAIAMILLGVNSLFHEVMIAAFGATAFCIFAMPKLKTSSARSVIGGYLIGIVVGVVLFTIVSHISVVYNIDWVFFVFGGVAIGIVTLLMTMTNTEHPPAAGLTLGLVLQGYNIKGLIVILVSVTVMVFVKHLLRNWLINLY